MFPILVFQGIALVVEYLPSLVTHSRHTHLILYFPESGAPDNYVFCSKVTSDLVEAFLYVISVEVTPLISLSIEIKKTVLTVSSASVVSLSSAS
jgi:hypothetical protein